MKKWKLKCVYCDQTQTFIDVYDIRDANWQQLGWNVSKVEPICLCDQCEHENYLASEDVKYGKPIRSKKKK